MSENENQPPAPSKQTSSVPLKKETVRVTLKAADAPPAVPSATVPMAPPVRPPVPGAPPTPTGGPPRPPAPAPTIPLRTAGAPAMSPAPTIRLASAAPTGAIKPAGGAPPTIALPKATVQLQAPTQPLGTSFSSPSQMSTLQADDDDDDGEENEGLTKILSGVGFLAAVFVLIFQLSAAGNWISADDSQTKGDWMQLFQ
jgi:hypothetical protein